MRMGIVFTNFEWRLKEIWVLKFVNKVNVNFNYYFRHFPESSFQFFCIISWVVSYSSCIVRFACFSSQNFMSFEFLWKIRFLLYWFHVTHTVETSTKFVVLVALGKTLPKEKYITQIDSKFFINIIKDFQYIFLPRYAWNAIFL